MRINNFIKVSVVFFFSCGALNSCDYGLYDGGHYSVYTYNSPLTAPPVFHRKPFRHITPPPPPRHDRLQPPKPYLWRNHAPKLRNNRGDKPGFKQENRSGWKHGTKQISPRNFNRSPGLFKR